MPPALITPAEMDARMDAGLDTFALDIPPASSATCWPDARPAMQLNVDATRMSQAFTGSGYIQPIVTGEVNAFVAGYRARVAPAGRTGVADALQPGAEQDLVRRA